MLERLGLLAVRATKQVLVVSLLMVAGAGLLGADVASRLSDGGFTDPGSESSRAAELLEDRFGVVQPNLILIVSTHDGRSVDDPAVRAAGERIAADLADDPDVAGVTSYWATGAPTLRGTDGRSAVITARLVGGDDAVRTRLDELGARYEDAAGTSADRDALDADTGRDGPGTVDGVVSVQLAGTAAVQHDMTEILHADLQRAEAYAAPLTLVLLLLIFSSVVAATLPLVIGVVAVVSTLLILEIVAAFTDVSVFALNLTTGLGLGLAIDYSLFMVSRFREELAAGVEPDDAVVRTVRTAGRTVIYSAATVAASLVALLVFPLYFLRSFAYAGIAVVVLAAVAAIVVLPALLALLGTRVNALAIRRRRRARRHARPRPELWGRIATVVMRRPVPIATTVVVLLLVLAAPFLGARYQLPDDRGLPQDAHSRLASNVVRADFVARELEAITVVSGSVVEASAVDSYAVSVSALDNVARVDAATGSYVAGRLVAPPSPTAAGIDLAGGVRLSVVSAAAKGTAPADDVVTAVRAVSAPVPVLVGGPDAVLVDTGAAIMGRLPLALGIVALSVAILLFAFTGSVLVPVKALVMNLLSLSATFGAMVWVFQEGHLRSLLGDFTVTGALDVTIPVLTFCVAFGLSMDYEVFLLSRIREEWDRTGDNRLAVARGLSQTGRLVTGAALLVSVVFLCFATSGVTSLKLLGVGMSLAVLMDATLVRGALVPAFMRLAGAANWWSPAPLRRLYDRYGLRESPATAGAPATRPRRGRQRRPHSVAVSQARPRTFSSPAP